MYLTMRTVWLLTACCLIVLAAPRPLTVVGCAGAVVLLVVGDVVAAPSPRGLRVRRSVERSVRLGGSTTATLTVTNTVKIAIITLTHSKGDPHRDQHRAPSCDGAGARRVAPVGRGLPRAGVAVDPAG